LPWRARVGQRGVALVAALLILAIFCLLDLMIGPSGMGAGELWQTFRAGPGGDDRAAAAILFQIRLPQTTMALIVGAALGLAGLMMQTILANPLASPFTLGFSAAAGFGAAASILFGAALGLPLPGHLLTPAAAFAATLAATLLVWVVARARGGQAEILVLGGIAVLFFFQSLQSLLQFLASPEVLQQIVFWLFGSLLKASWTSVAVTGSILVLCLPLVLRSSWALTTLRLGDANARSLGLSVERVRREAFLIVAVLTAAAVCFVGTIGFVGLIAPHVARTLVGEDHRFSLPLSAIIGAIILLGATIFGKLISPGAAIPVGIITAVAGVPMLFSVIVKRQKESTT